VWSTQPKILSPPGTLQRSHALLSAEGCGRLRKVYVLIAVNAVFFTVLAVYLRFRAVVHGTSKSKLLPNDQEAY